MNVGFFYFDRFANHEIIIAHHALRRQNIISLAINKGVYTSTENQKILVENDLTSIEPKLIDVLVIPGGFADAMMKNEALLSFLVELEKLNKTIAAICGGTFILASSGILKNRECTGHFINFDNGTPEVALFSEAKLIDKDIVVDGNIITARGKAFIEFGLAIALHVGIINENECREELSWMMNNI